MASVTTGVVKDGYIFEDLRHTTDTKNESKVHQLFRDTLNHYFGPYGTLTYSCIMTQPEGCCSHDVAHANIHTLIVPLIRRYVLSSPQ